MLIFYCFFLVECPPSGCSRPHRLNLDKFDINSVLKSGVHLTGSEGSEYNQDEAGLCDILKQRQLLNSKLGLDMVGKIDLGLGDIISPDDLSSSKEFVQDDCPGVCILFITFYFIYILP